MGSRAGDAQSAQARPEQFAVSWDEHGTILVVAEAILLNVSPWR